ncbi:dimethylhistidine N-methyltransferase [Niastella yeongjuensis]|uniref:Dimethylhistidine N-methyltransferase n=1 Tax=Niastella yeongjuensis TaxID=354355 RepID=A0A1V9EGK0_9BACT|nr:L-histidine N(alpha)-methyltransferase [Niastella yeongjuensis]OQP45277.1 dimethylhistidine N-methyltransferase [Niastella yeongjuensis]SEO27453.1 dimethylhistidine N-methyltransferase [Niastella yeongjuensis]
MVNGDFVVKFYNEVIAGLSQYPKRLPSKYFYDATGDNLFQQIMHSPDYYVTRCELEIFTTQLPEMTKLVIKDGSPFDLIELGPGDCYKSIHLMKELTRLETDFNYLPIDISGAVLDQINTTLPPLLPNMPVQCMNGEYFQMLSKAKWYSSNRKVVLCLGGNIGNMTVEESHTFCKALHKHLNPGDLVIIGFDLVKNPNVIRTAYYDREGITSLFNLNLLERINQELEGNFNLNDFEHYCSYEPETGACKSFLVCLADRIVRIRNKEIIFKKDEYIWMEISQKYNPGQISEMALSNGFKPIGNLMDSKRWFADACWEVI